MKFAKIHCIAFNFTSDIGEVYPTQDGGWQTLYYADFSEGPPRPHHLCIIFNESFNCAELHNVFEHVSLTKKIDVFIFFPAPLLDQVVDCLEEKFPGRLLPSRESVPGKNQLGYDIRKTIATVADPPLNAKDIANTFEAYNWEVIMIVNEWMDSQGSYAIATPEESVSEVIEKLAEAEVSICIILDSRTNDPRGIWSQKHANNLIAFHLANSPEGTPIKDIKERLSQTPISNVMKPVGGLVNGEVGMPMKNAAQDIAEHSKLVIFNPMGKVAGVLTNAGVLKWWVAQ